VLHVECAAGCCSVLQCAAEYVAVCCSVLECDRSEELSDDHVTSSQEQLVAAGEEYVAAANFLDLSFCAFALQRAQNVVQSVKLVVFSPMRLLVAGAYVQ